MVVIYSGFLTFQASKFHVSPIMVGVLVHYKNAINSEDNLSSFLDTKIAFLEIKGLIQYPVGPGINTIPRWARDYYNTPLGQGLLQYHVGPGNDAIPRWAGE